MFGLELSSWISSLITKWAWRRRRKKRNALPLIKQNVQFIMNKFNFFLNIFLKKLWNLWIFNTNRFQETSNMQIQNHSDYQVVLKKLACCKTGFEKKKTVLKN